MCVCVCVCVCVSVCVCVCVCVRLQHLHIGLAHRLGRLEEPLVVLPPLLIRRLLLPLWLLGLPRLPLARGALLIIIIVIPLVVAEPAGQLALLLVEGAGPVRARVFVRVYTCEIGMTGD